MDPKRERQILRRLNLQWTEPSQLTIRRVACGRGFTYVNGTGAPLKDPDIRQRIAGLAIPPAWRDVRIADDPRSHVQAIGRDDADRLQYLYHPDWEQVRSVRKAERLRRFGLVLPDLRERLAADVEEATLCRRMSIAAAVTLIDKAALRAGHEAYAGEEGGRGAATLLKRHASVADDRVLLAFRGKGGRKIKAAVADARLARAIGRLLELRGTRLFKAPVERGFQPITAEDLNDYLREVTGEDITAKDFRTFHASARAVELLCGIGPARQSRERRRRIVEVARQVGELLHNTPAVARSSYIHPIVLDLYEESGLDPVLLRPKWRHGLTAAETALMRILDQQEG